MAKKPKEEAQIERARVEELSRDLTDDFVALGSQDVVDLRLVLRDWLRDRDKLGRKLTG